MSRDMWTMSTEKVSVNKGVLTPVMQAQKGGLMDCLEKNFARDAFAAARRAMQRLEQWCGP